MWFLRAQESHRTTWTGVRSARFGGFSAPKNRTVPRGFASGVIVFGGVLRAQNSHRATGRARGFTAQSAHAIFPFLVPQKSLRPTGIHSGPGGKRPPPASSAATLGSARTGPRLALFLFAHTPFYHGLYVKNPHQAEPRVRLHPGTPLGTERAPEARAKGPCIYIYIYNESLCSKN